MNLNHALNVRSDFSIGESLLRVPDIIKNAAAKGLEAVALVDTMTVSGMIEFSQKCAGTSIKPIIGCRVKVLDCDPTVHTKEFKNPPHYYLKLYVKTEAGLRQLFKLLSLGNSAERFYYFPRLCLSDVLQALQQSNGGLLATTGDAFSLLYKRTDEVVDAVLERLVIAAGAENVLVEATVDGAPYYDANFCAALKAARRNQLSAFVSCTANQPDDNDPKNLDVLAAISSNSQIGDRWTLQPSTVSAGMKLASGQELARRALTIAKTRLGDDYVKDAIAALGNNEWLTKQITYTWAKMPVSLPVLFADPVAQLVKACQEGFAKRIMHESCFGYRVPPTLYGEYAERLKYELGVLAKLGFADYFHLVQHITSWSKTAGVKVGPGRGSVGGSLVAFVMGITDVDPIRFGLIFERFINPERLDLPDADLDFQSSRRGDVLKYVVERFGSEKVAGISNFTTLAGASAIRDAGRVSGLSGSDLTCTTFFPKEHGQPVTLDEAKTKVMEIGKFADTYPQIWSAAKNLEGVMRSLSKHAAGVVVAGVPLTERCVVEMRGGDLVTNWDKRVVEDMGLVKMDVLGLSTLDLLQIAVENVLERTGTQLDILDLPLDDEPTLQAFGQGRGTAVFQFESGGMVKLLKDLARYSPLTFEDIAAATALYRPGPIDAGLLEQYVACKQGVMPVVYPHESTRKTLESTYGVMVYQEQVMQISRDLAGFTMAEADKLRKSIGKKDMESMKKMRDAFVGGATAGWLDVQMSDGSMRRFHRREKLRVVESADRFTIEEILSKGLTLSDNSGL